MSQTTCAPEEDLALKLKLRMGLHHTTGPDVAVCPSLNTWLHSPTKTTTFRRLPNWLPLESSFTFPAGRTWDCLTDLSLRFRNLALANSINSIIIYYILHILECPSPNFPVHLWLCGPVYHSTGLKCSECVDHATGKKVFSNLEIAGCRFIKSVD